MDCYSFEQEPLNMTATEVIALQRNINDIKTSIDPIALTQMLMKAGVITRELNSRVFKMFENEKTTDQICSYLLCHLRNQMSLQRLIECLYRCKYLHLATKLFVSFIGESKKKVKEIFGSLGYRAVHPRILEMIDPCFHIQSDKTLRTLAASSLLLLARGSDIRLKKRIADALLGIQGTRLSAVTDISGSCSHLHNKTCGLILIQHEDQVAELEFYNEMANIATGCGEHVIAEQMHIATATVDYIEGTVLENLNLLHTEIYTTICWSEESNNDSCRDKDGVLMWGLIGLEIIDKDIPQDQKAAWINLFCLLLACFLLGIRRNGEVTKGYVKTECKREAGNFLCRLDKGLEEMTTSQKRLYYLLKGRFYELSNNIELSLQYISKATRVQCEGNFQVDVKENILKYEQEIRERLRPEQDRTRNDSFDDTTKSKHVSRQLPEVSRNCYTEKPNWDHCDATAGQSLRRNECMLTSSNLQNQGQLRKRNTKGRHSRLTSCKEDHQSRQFDRGRHCMTVGVNQLSNNALQNRIEAEMCVLKHLECHRTVVFNTEISVTQTMKEENYTELQHCLMPLKSHTLEYSREQNDEHFKCGEPLVESITRSNPGINEALVLNRLKGESNYFYKEPALLARLKDETDTLQIECSETGKACTQLTSADPDEIKAKFRSDFIGFDSDSVQGMILNVYPDPHGMSQMHEECTANSENNCDAPDHMNVSNLNLNENKQRLPNDMNGNASADKPDILGFIPTKRNANIYSNCEDDFMFGSGHETDERVTKVKCPVSVTSSPRGEPDGASCA